MHLCARSLYDISVTSSLEEFAWQDLCKRPLGKNLCNKSPCPVSVQGQGLQKRCPGKISVQELYKRSLGKTLEEICLCEIATEDLRERPMFKLFYKISEKDRCSLHQVSVQDL